jgi:hypothetical protein
LSLVALGIENEFVIVLYREMFGFVQCNTKIVQFENGIDIIMLYISGLRWHDFFICRSKV